MLQNGFVLSRTYARSETVHNVMALWQYEYKLCKWHPRREPERRSPPALQTCWCHELRVVLWLVLFCPFCLKLPSVYLRLLGAPEVGGCGFGGVGGAAQAAFAAFQGAGYGVPGGLPLPPEVDCHGGVGARSVRPWRQAKGALGNDGGNGGGYGKGAYRPPAAPPALVPPEVWAAPMMPLGVWPAPGLGFGPLGHAVCGCRRRWLWHGPLWWSSWWSGCSTSSCWFL